MKREIRNQISLGEGGQKTLSLQFLYGKYISVGFSDVLPEVPLYNVYITKNVPAIKTIFAVSLSNNSHLQFFCHFLHHLFKA